MQLLLAALAVLVALGCLATRREFGRRMRGALLTSLVATIPVFTLGMASLPAYFVTLVSFAGVESATGLAQVLVNAVGTVLLVFVAISYRRRLRGRCPRCGQAHPGTGDGPRVPRLLPLLPAWLAAVGLSVYGVLLLIFASLAAAGVLPGPAIEPPFTSSSGITWMVAFGGLAFGGLGFALITAARSYATRSRPVCAAHLPEHGPADTSARPAPALRATPRTPTDAPPPGRRP
ncbi:hypothetical protein [Actinophytocola xanthii]|uniref:hypothetical protein n=1 Tax=Actinophytocola xanthii TaxID=1912961 RepID=UPI0018E9E35C|nr:hypothetical protein [Actinophytocola xanthii]